jgi:hypothetical protein
MACTRVRQRLRKRKIIPEMSDGIAIELRRERDRLHKQQARRRAGIEPRNFSNKSLMPSSFIEVLVPAGPIIGWLNAYLARNSSNELARAVGWNEKRIRTIASGWYVSKGNLYEIKRLSLDVVAKLLEAAGQEYLLTQIYPDGSVRRYQWKAGAVKKERPVKQDEYRDMVSEYMGRRRVRKPRAA